ncbi:MAG: hypothetical protein ACO1QB_04325 [Verrucomicrobiales bacterium]
MSEKVQRFVVKAFPKEDHPKYYPWQTATLCVFIGEDRREKSVELAKAFLGKQGWNVCEFLDKATLIESRVREAGEEIWKAYQQAKNGEPFLREELDQLSPAHKDGGIAPQRAPRMTEAFIDHVISRAGGRRITASEADPQKTRNADYFLDDYVLELKTLEEEGLSKDSRQEKLANLLAGVKPDVETIPINPTGLGREEFRAFLDIVGGPIKTAVRSASDQIKKTKSHLQNESLKGGVIFVNSGYGSLPPTIFEQCVERFVTKDTKQIELVVCISTWFLTNGFDSSMNFKFSPEESVHPTIVKFQKAFWACVEEWMTEFGRGGFQVTGEFQNALHPITFEKAGKLFSALPPSLPSEWDKAIREAAASEEY